jgi:arylsulfatase A-like enzyme
MGAEHPTLAEVLAAHGYVTGAFSANLLYVHWESGLDRGFTRFEGYRTTPGQIFLSTALGRRIITGKHGWETGLVVRLAGYRDFVGRKRADDVNASVLEWIDDRGGRPYFAFLNYFDAHLPYMPPAPFAGRFGRPRPRPSLAERIRREWTRDGYWDMPAEELEAEIAAYQEAIAYLDDRLGRLLDTLERRGGLENTLIVLTSDHGEEFGEHGDYEHGSNLYMEQLHVPLVIAFPGRVPEGVRVAEPVSIRDVPATVMELLGLPPTQGFAGASLAGSWTGSATPRPAVAELAPGLRPEHRMRAVVAGRFHYVLNPAGRRELYDWVADPAERSNLIATSMGSAAARRLDALLGLVLQR